MPRKKKATKQPWKGAAPSVLNRVEQEFCPLSRRPTISPNDSPDVAQALGKLIDSVHRFVEKEAGQPIEKQEIAQAIGQAASHFTEFLKGRRTGEAWLDRGRQALAYILTGRIDLKDADEDVREIATRIDSHFLRGKKLKYFDPNRAGTPDAWTYGELSGEIQLFGRGMRTDSTYEIWYFSGGDRFFADDDQKIRPALASCLQLGATLTFVFPVDAHEVQAQLTVFKDEFEGDVRIIQLDSSYPTASTFLTPSARYLLLHDLGADAESEDDDVSRLWIQRPTPSEHDIEVRGPTPRAWLGLRRELLSVRRWITKLQEWQQPEDVPHGKSEPNPNCDSKSESA